MPTERGTGMELNAKRRAGMESLDELVRIEKLLENVRAQIARDREDFPDAHVARIWGPLARLERTIEVGDPAGAVARFDAIRVAAAAIRYASEVCE